MQIYLPIAHHSIVCLWWRHKRRDHQLSASILRFVQLDSEHNWRTSSSCPRGHDLRQWNALPDGWRHIPIVTSSAKRLCQSSCVLLYTKRLKRQATFSVSSAFITPGNITVTFHVNGYSQYFNSIILSVLHFVVFYVITHVTWCISVA